MNHSFAFTIEHPSDSNLDEEVEGEVSIISYGSSASYWDPGDPPEWEVEEITVNRELIPVYLKPRLRDRFEAWFNARPIKKRLNPEWERYADLVDRHMSEDFDWMNAEADAAEDYYNYHDEY